MADDHAPDTDRAHAAWLVGPCDGCGGDMPETGWMRETGRTWDGLPVVEFFCSRTCIPPRKGPT